jgi:hypothetical protein
MMSFSFRAIVAIILTLAVASFAIPVLEERGIAIDILLGQLDDLTGAVTNSYSGGGGTGTGVVVVPSGTVSTVPVVSIIPVVLIIPVVSIVPVASTVPVATVPTTAVSYHHSQRLFPKC